MARPLADRSPRLPAVGAAGAFCGATLALLGLFRVHAALHLDTARDLLLARDCVVGVHCSGAGPRSSFGGWTQGALWSHLLELREHLGLGLAALELAAIVALAIAAALVPVAARSLERPATALTWALWFPATVLTSGYPTLWNPTLWPLVLGLFQVALLHAARTRGVLPFAAAAAALALAVDVHVASAVLVPFVVAVIVGRAARPLLALPIAAGVAAFVLAVDSPGAFAENRELVLGHAPAITAALALAACVGLFVRRRLGACAVRSIAVAQCVYLLLAFVLLALGTGHPLHARYLAPLVTPAALLLGACGRAGAGRAAAALVCAAYVAFWLDDRLHNQRFRLVEAERVAAALYGRGLAFGDLYQRLRGPFAFDLVSTLAALEPAGHRGAARDDLDLLVVRTARYILPTPVPPDWTVIDLDRSHAAVIVPYRPWVRSDRFEVCTAADARRTCTALSLAPAMFARRPDTRWADRAHAVLPGLQRPGRGDRLEYRLPLRPSPGEPARRVRLFADECEGWRIGGDGPLARLSADDPAGDITFTVIAGPRCRGWLPPFVELPGSETALDALLPPLPAP